MDWNRPLPALIPVSQSRSLTGLPRTTIYSLAGEGRLKLLKVNGRTFIDRASFEAFFATLPAAEIRRGAV